jgi:hypothetical protein
MTHDATVRRITDERGERCVVVQADEEIWIADELWDQAADPDRERFTGDMEIDGDLISFGTPGEGLGRLTYRRVGRREREHVAVRVDSGPASVQVYFGEPTESITEDGRTRYHTDIEIVRPGDPT